MPSFVVTGAARGLGARLFLSDTVSYLKIELTKVQLEFVGQLSSDADNVVFGLVQDKEATEKQVGSDLPKNLTVLQADITDVQALKETRQRIPVPTGLMKSE